MTAEQKRMPLEIEARTVLSTLEGAREHIKRDAETVLARVDSGALRWVFNIAVSLESRRDLRFYTAELIAPEMTAALTLDQVITGIIGQDTAIRTGRLETEWVCSHNHIHALIKAGELTLIGPGRVSRLGLALFLKRRLQGAKS